MLTLQEIEENTYNDQKFVLTLNSTFHNGNHLDKQYMELCDERKMYGAWHGSNGKFKSIPFNKRLYWIDEINLIDRIFDRLKNFISLNTSALD